MARKDADAKATLWSVAAAQRGYFTAAQALESGYSHQSQRYNAEQGNWRRVDRGIYRFREFDALPSDEDDHLARWELWSKGRAVVSHETALAVHDLGTANPARIHLTVPPGFRMRNDALVLHQAVLNANEIEQRQGYKVTTPVRSIAECAAAQVDQDVLDSAVAEALERGVVSRRRLFDAAQRLGPPAELSIDRALREAG
ncbi:type IV toxin-antitoxin system AbiEi family antitoxin domain-containing protein [Actinocatenispora comari]|jgi:predicted transcriptional regulator of viral defense system|uniref:Transcriptional regulator, AbiEi antitoxin, Type IV TA system n=1 Tax=Actinocatenispora comari TaxID=2807577 RepID=A0A8J4AE98_9ACTN|nr:type IV toxin-antitoxin system AbiEi family antitoxin domain-containing protein [Actinocatenispora comari]GIL29458.1 hypothetical protein NUM_47120 [Actinocatenispora comari]